MAAAASNRPRPPDSGPIVTECTMALTVGHSFLREFNLTLEDNWGSPIGGQCSIGLECVQVSEVALCDA